MGSFRSSDLEAVRQAVERAERRTSGEIVPYVLSRSAVHETILWRGAVVGFAVGAVLIGIIRLGFGGWSMPFLYSAWTVHAFMAIGAALGVVLVRFVPAVFRGLAGSAYLDRVVHERAVRAFVDEEVFATQDRTGILLLVSLLERRIEVLGDAGINAAVAEDEWADVIGIVRRGLRDGRAAEALVEAIDACGDLLDRPSVERQADDRNELTDRLRIDPDALAE